MKMSPIECLEKQIKNIKASMTWIKSDMGYAVTKKRNQELEKQYKEKEKLISQYEQAIIKLK